MNKKTIERENKLAEKLFNANRLIRQIGPLLIGVDEVDLHPELLDHRSVVILRKDIYDCQYIIDRMKPSRAKALGEALILAASEAPPEDDPPTVSASKYYIGKLNK